MNAFSSFMHRLAASRFILPGRLLLLFCLLLLSLLTSCGNKNNPPISPENEARLLRDQGFVSSGLTRNYHLFLPENPSSAPIVFLVHGNSGSSNQILGLIGTKAPFKIWMDIARQDNIILVVPDGVEGPNDEQGWNDCRLDAWTNPNADDVSFLNSLLDDVKSRYGTSATPVSKAGISNGGLMAQRLAEEIPEKLDAIAVVVASKPANSECVA